MSPDDIEHREHILAVFREQGGGYTYALDENGPSYCATYGWSVTWDLPELIVFGTHYAAMRQLPAILDAMISELPEGAVVRDGQTFPVLEDGRACVGRLVHPDHLDERWFEEALACRREAATERPMRALQLFWPDAEGRYPWEAGCRPATAAIQPLLFQPRPGAP